MKKLLVVLVVVAIALLGASAAMAGISATKHNLSTTGPNAAIRATAETEICIFCHTPHGADPAIAPLWNKPDQSQSYGAYGNTKAGTAVTAPSAGVSYACMACHDGVSAMGAVLNDSTAGIVASTIAMGGTMPATGSLGANMNNDHPVSFTYNTAVAGMKQLDGATVGAGDVVRPVGPAVGTLPLGTAGATMECSSCHEPHANVVNFLRMANTNSDLCLSCHLK